MGLYGGFKPSKRIDPSTGDISRAGLPSHILHMFEQGVSVAKK